MPRLIIVLDITGDVEDAFEAVDKALDNGVLQDAINGYEGDTEDEEDDDNDVDESPSSIHVTSAVVCSPSNLIDAAAIERAHVALRAALGKYGGQCDKVMRETLLAVLEGDKS